MSLARLPIIVFHQEIISLFPITQRLPSRTKRHKPQNVTRNRTRNMLPWKWMFCRNYLQEIFCFRKYITVNKYFKGYAAQRTVYLFLLNGEYSDPGNEYLLNNFQGTMWIKGTNPVRKWSSLLMVLNGLSAELMIAWGIFNRWLGYNFPLYSTQFLVEFALYFPFCFLSLYFPFCAGLQWTMDFRHFYKNNLNNFVAGWTVLIWVLGWYNINLA